MTEVTTEMPRSRSIAIQSERVDRRSRLALTWPARLIAPPNSRSFSVSVVLPASGWEMMAKVRLRATSVLSGDAVSEGASPASTILFMAGMWQGKAAGSRGGRLSAHRPLAAGLSAAAWTIQQRRGIRLGAPFEYQRRAW